MLTDRRNETWNFNPRSLAGATEAIVGRCLLQSISIHAPSRERRLAKSIRRIYMHFNPRSLAGATIGLANPFPALPISIHAPSRERPAYIAYISFSIRNSNPRSLAGATLAASLACSRSCRFQSTLPRGSDKFL